MFKQNYFFVLAMFPYPSGKLHMGHLRVYAVADVLARYYGSLGKQVIFPMGWDAFGLPAENAAIDRSELPSEWTNANIKSMRNQLTSDMLLAIDWSREFSTCDPNYYKWTQWLFIQLFQSGLAYQRLSLVNWDPIDQTVLANELIDTKGRSWRSGAIVQKRVMRQWYFRSLAYSKSLIDGLNDIEGQQWRDVIKMQKGWIGPVDGYSLEFDVKFHNAGNLNLTNERVAVFTHDPGIAAAGAISHIAVGHQNIFWDERFRQPVNDRGPNSSRKLLCSTILPTRADLTDTCPRKLSVMPAALCAPWPEKLAITAKHPLYDREIPLVYDPNLRARVHYETEIEFGVPDLFAKDADVATFLELHAADGKLAVTKVPTEDIIIKSSPVTEFTDLALVRANELAIRLLQGPQYRIYACSRHRKDWLISRQRYWATPIPLVYCSKCGTVPVPEAELPVRLPPLKKAFQRGAVPLKENTAWRSTTCPKCGGFAERETDTLDTFVDSSWYYLRFLDPTNSETLCSTDNAARSMPVDIYIGGIEHAIRHLFYARFVAHFLHDLGIMPCREPFLRFLPVGLVLSRTFTDPVTGRFFSVNEVEEVAGFNGQVAYRVTATGQSVLESWEKMSKSKCNGVEPADVVARHGIELTRLTMLASVGPHAARQWDEGEILRGVMSWQTRIWRLVRDFCDFASKASQDSGWPDFESVDVLAADARFMSEYSRVLLQVNNCLGKSFVISAAIANLQKLTTLLLKHSKEGPYSPLYLRALADLIIMLYPLSPAFACEVWEGFCIAMSHSTAPNMAQLLKNRVDWTYDLSENAMQQPFPEKPPEAM